MNWFDVQTDRGWACDCGDYTGGDAPVFLCVGEWIRNVRNPGSSRSKVSLEHYVCALAGGEGAPLTPEVVIASVHCNDAVELAAQVNALILAVEHRCALCQRSA